MNIIFKLAFASAFALSLPSLAAAQACPNYGTSGARLQLTAESAYIPQGASVIAGGPLNLSACPSIPGNGYIVETPDFTMSYDALGMGRDLEIRVEGSCDTVLLVNTASGEWLFNDDSDGANPAIRMTNAGSGGYDIWVGTFDAAPCEATLIVETF